MSVKLISCTPDAEKTMAYIARVSNPANQDNENIAGLLKYCLKHNHWSVFEQAHITLEIKTTRDIAAQILRHRSFTFQEFSQRYAAVTKLAPVPELRLQDHKNSQNSIEVGDDDDMAHKIELFQIDIGNLFQEIQTLYEEMLNFGIAKECARKILPLNTETTIYMTGNVRSWINYINLRSANGTQKEHMDIALQAKEVVAEQLPIVATALGWTSEE